MGILVPSQPYIVAATITNPGAVTNLNVQSSATNPLVIVNALIEIAQATIPSPAGCRIKFVRKTAAPTVTNLPQTGFVNINPTDPDAAFTAGHTASAEGTDGDGYERGWRSDVGYAWNPTPEEYIVVPAGTANGLGLKSSVAPPAGIYTFTLFVHQIG